MKKCEICGRELKLNEDHRDCVIRDYAKCIEDLEQTRNQKAIECLKEVKDSFCSSGMIFYADCGLSQKEKDLILNNQEEDKNILADIIDTKIKELEGEE